MDLINTIRNLDKARELNEGFDEKKLLQLARIGLVSDVSMFKRVLKKLNDGKVLAPNERQVIYDAFTSFAELITMDPTVFQKARKAVKEEIELDEAAMVSTDKLNKAVSSVFSPKVSAQVLGQLKPGTKKQVSVKDASAAMTKMNMSPRQIANVMSALNEEALDEAPLVSKRVDAHTHLLAMVKDYIGKASDSDLQKLGKMIGKKITIQGKKIVIEGIEINLEEEMNMAINSVEEAKKWGLTQSLLDAVKTVIGHEATSDDSKEMDPVNKAALKKDFKDRKDKDIDNDGDVDDSDEYLHNRRKEVSKNVAGKDDEKEEKPEAGEKEEKPEAGEKEEKPVDVEKEKKMAAQDAVKKYKDKDKAKNSEEAKKEKEYAAKKSNKQEPVDVSPQMEAAGCKTMKEAEMTDAQMKKREEIVKSMKDKKGDFEKRYGDRSKDVMYATATKMAMKEGFEFESAEAFFEAAGIPFDGPYKKVKRNVKDKSGAVHTPMSRAKDLAKKAMKKEEVELDEISAETKASYKKKAGEEVKQLEPHAKKGEYKDLAKNLIAKRKKGIEQADK